EVKRELMSTWTLSPASESCSRFSGVSSISVKTPTTCGRRSSVDFSEYSPTETVVASSVEWMVISSSSESSCTCSSDKESTTSSKEITDRPCSPARTNMPRLEASSDSGGTVAYTRSWPSRSMSVAATGMVASISSGDTEISGAVTEFSESSRGQSNDDCVCVTGKNGVARNNTKPMRPVMIAANRSPLGAGRALSSGSSAVETSFTTNTLVHSSDDNERTYLLNVPIFGIVEHLWVKQDDVITDIGLVREDIHGEVFLIAIIRRINIAAENHGVRHIPRIVFKCFHEFLWGLIPGIFCPRRHFFIALLELPQRVGVVRGKSIEAVVGVVGHK